MTGGITTVSSSRFAAGWLTLREPADAAARATELLDPLRDYLARIPTSRLVIRDLGCGTGALGRWLAGRLGGQQHWILHDRDPDLLAHAGSSAIGATADGGRVTREIRQGDVTELCATDLAGTSLVAASALLDLLTGSEVEGLARTCAAAGCPALLTLSVTGQVELTPSHPLDAEVAAAFDAHQRRTIGERRLLGPDAPAAATEAFERHGTLVHSRPSPWRLDTGQSALAAEWLRGWVGAACEQRPDLARYAADYLRQRQAACAAGELRVVVHHVDLLALPPAEAAGGLA